MMKKSKVYITRRIPTEVKDKIAEYHDVRVWEEDTPVPRSILEQEITEADGLFCLLTESIDANLINRAKRLKVISNMAVGYDNIDVEAATEKGIMVTNTPGVLTETTADLTFALLMATARRLVEASDYLRGGHWQTWAPMLLTGHEIHGATLGIIGAGRIGQALAKRAQGFDMNVLYYSRSRKPEAEQHFGMKFTDLENLLQTSDFVCIMTPNTIETKNLIDYRELSLMKKTAILINTARGGIVNEHALYRALTEGLIWAAGLDVFEEEPMSLEHPLLKLPNLLALPHIGSASINTRLRMADLAAQNLLQALSGSVPENLINPKILACGHRSCLSADSENRRL